MHKHINVKQQQIYITTITKNNWDQFQLLGAS
jgi:hypothetical protein